MGISSSKSANITTRRDAENAAPSVAEEDNREGDENVTVIILGPRWVRDRHTGQQYVEKNRRRIDMLERRGEVTHALREKGKRFFTRYPDGTMQIDPIRAPVDEAVTVEVPAAAPVATVVTPVAVAA